MSPFRLFSAYAAFGVAVVSLCVGTSAMASGVIHVDGSAGQDAWSGLCATWDGATCGPKETIQAGLDAAQAGDTVLVADGLYQGAGNVNLDFGGKAVVLRSVNGADHCVIDCEGASRGFYFHSGERLESVLEGFTVRNGFSVASGGGIACMYQSMPTIRRCVISNCRTSNDGGGIYASRSPVRMEDCVIEDNSARNFGGGVSLFSGANARIRDCVIRGNVCMDDDELCGGGGGISCVTSSAYVTRCTITGNSGKRGGGVVCAHTGNALLVNNTVTGNLAADGGGVAIVDSSPYAVGCLVAGNRSLGGLYSYGGGGILCCVGWPAFVNCTIANNAASAIESSDDGLVGGGMAVQAGSLGGEYAHPTVVNCVLWGNTALNGSQISLNRAAPAGPAPGLDIAHSQVQGGQASVWVAPGSSGVLNWDASNGDTDPLFADADGPDDDPDTIADNNYRLSAGSPCIDSGSNAVLPTDTTDVDRDDVTLELLPEDLDGNHRLWDDPATPDSGEGTPPIVDRGVYEYGSIPPAPVLLAAESLKQHGSVGSFGISVGSQAVEPRVLGPTELVVQFNYPIALLTGGLTDVSLSSGQAVAVSARDRSLTISLSGASDETNLQVAFPGVVRASDPSIGVEGTLCFGVLGGDTTGDRQTNIFDLVAIRNQLNTSVTAGNCRCDLTCDGAVNIFDLVTARNNLNHSIGSGCP